MIACLLPAKGGIPGNWKGRQPRVSVFLLLSLLLGFVGGCGGQSIPPPPQMSLEIRADAKANQGKVFYILVRSTNEKQYLTETYANIAALVFANPPDPSVLGAFPVFPNKKQKIQVVQPSQNPVAFYFLFTEASDQWRQLVDQPLVDSYIIQIHGDRVQIKEDVSFWSWLF